MLGMQLLGENLFLLKLWLFPFTVILVWSLRELLRRFSPGMETPLLWVTIVSPWLLPSFNFMLDVPVLALMLLVLVLFLRASDISSVPLSLLTGLVAGAAMQTKYNAATILVAILGYGLLFRRLRLAVFVALAAAVVFVSWECFVYSLHGTSQFLVLLFRESRFAAGSKDNLLKSLFLTAGQVASVLIPVGVLALGGRPWKTVAAIAAVAASFWFLALSASPHAWKLSMTWMGPVLFATIAVAAWPLRGDRMAQFLLLWLAVEVAGVFLLSPYPAVRRFFGMIVVMTFLLGRRLSQQPSVNTRLLNGATAMGAVLGLVVWLAGWLDSIAEVSIAQRALADIHKRGDQRTIWYLPDHWKGFQFVAPRLGMAPVHSGRSLLKAGDWLVRDFDSKIHEHGIDATKLEVVEVYNDTTVFPLRILPDYFGGKYAIRHRESPRILGAVYKVREDFIPQDPLLLVRYW